MSNRWPGGIIRKTPVTPAGPFQNGAASGVWSLADAAYWTKQGLWPLAGNTLPAIEDYFSTYLYTGNGSTQTITTGIDLAGKGGMLWIKNRSAATNNIISDTVRGAGNFLMSNSSSQQFFNTDNVSALSSTGFSVGVDSNTNGTAGNLYASWTFREAPKFFDVVTVTSNSSGGAEFSHNLGSTPGMVIIKCTSAGESWWVWHRSLATNQYMSLNLTNAVGTQTPTITCTSTTVTLTSGWLINNNATYVAYLFAHDPTADGIIQCGSYTGNGSASGPVINLGWEPQWLMVKNASGIGNWQLLDNMRGMPVGSADATLQANLSNAESSVDYVTPTATGFQVVSTSTEVNTNASNYIYIAIRRGPMRTPTLGTSVFAPVTRTGTGATVYTTTSGFAPDSVWMDARSQSGKGPGLFDRLRGLPQLLQTTTTSSEVTNAGYIGLMGNTGYTSNADAYYNTSSQTFVDWIFRRAPGFFDQVCYTGTNSGTVTFQHNLGVVPELIITKSRTSANDWWTTFNMTASNFQITALNYGSTPDTYSYGAGTGLSSQPTASSVATNSFLNPASNNVAYLFASCPGVSKVGSYTGNGSSQTINCGFAAGARFVMIKRTSANGAWYVWDSARGIVAGNDPYLALNTTAAEVTTDDSVDTDNTGFIVNQVAASNVNVTGATYIFLAIA